MASEVNINMDGGRSLRNGARNKDALEKFEKSRSRINTPSWMREITPYMKSSNVTTDDEINNQSVPLSDHQNLPNHEYDNNDESYNESKENLSSISRDSDSTTFILEKATQHVDKSSSTGRIRYSDYRRACSALADAVKSRNKTLSSNSTHTRPNSYDRYLSSRNRYHTDVTQLSHLQMHESQLDPQQTQTGYAMQRTYGYARNLSRESSPAPPPFPPPPPPPPDMTMSTESNNLPTGENCNLPGSVAVGRWSTSTLCDSAYSGNNTPTDSVISECKSNFSSRGFLHSSNSTMRQKPYLGWRSQDNLLDSKLSTLSNDPTQRLAYTYKQGILSGRASVAGVFSGGGRLSTDSFSNIGGMRSQSYSRSLPRNCYGSHLREFTPNNQQQQHYQDQQNELHESIKSVSSAIMEFCKADDVPLPPPDDNIRRRHIRTKDQHQKSKVVWMESSFVSGKDSSNINNNNIQINVTTAAPDNKAPI